ncbi:3,4-dihydroxy-2-butanone-4-phosphate synthase [Sphingobium lactosutens]|uniref:3,4-dihydroxy-2-butanone-4-phosphate synthase n=1 Tax=Sphingobium lactosutens TaxID=522773 RepID=UPI0015C0FA06|nr:3,4-dihydroxy-2-butanone-4-phosphate synthase [Sphingobium lactosutens]
MAILIDRQVGTSGSGILFQDAASVTDQDVNRMVIHGRGVVTVAVFAERALKLGLSRMAGSRPSGRRFLTTVEATACRETGISAAERAITIAVMGSSHSHAGELVTPGHVLPSLATSRFEPGEPLADTALRSLQAHRGTLALAWCDILDDCGDIGTASHCGRLAERLSIPLFERSGAHIVPTICRDLSPIASPLYISDQGLNIAQLA